MSNRGTPAKAGSARRRTALAGTICALALAAAGCQSASSGEDSGTGGATRGPVPGRVLLAVPVELRQTLREYPCSAATSAGAGPSGGPAGTVAGAASSAAPTATPDGVTVAPAGSATSTAIGVAPAAAPPSGGAMAPANQSPMTGNVRDLDGADCFDLTQPLLTLQRLDSIGVSDGNTDDDWVINLGLTPSDARSLAGLTTGHTGQQLAVVVRGTVLATPQVTGQGTGIQISGDFSQDDARRLMRQITG